ncbi:MAG: hypothetical protein QOI36_6289, partial [Pseudonocardiales bacterium]|nr:hypothetical protein [Pseudonocardiales bacterium]
VHTPAASQAEPAGASDSAARSGLAGRKLALLLLALLWPAQIINVANVLSANTQNEIAQYFHTTQIAWFDLIYILFGTLLTPLAVRCGDLFGQRRVIIGIVTLGLIGNVITAIAPTYPLMLIGRGIAACFVPIAALVFVAVRELFPARRVAAATGIIGASAGGIVALVSRAEMGVASGMSLMLIGLMTTVGFQVPSPCSTAIRPRSKASRCTTTPATATRPAVTGACVISSNAESCQW